MIFQEPLTALNPVMTIGEQIAEVRAASSRLGRARRMRARRSRRCAWRRCRTRSGARGNIRTNFRAACGSAR